MKRLREMEARLEGLSGQSEVEEAQAQVSRMMGRIRLLQPYTIMAALETLVEVACRQGHKEAEYYKKALAECRQREHDEGFPDLVKHLFGTSEDKKIVQAVQAWRKHQKVDPSPASASGSAGPPSPAQSGFHPSPYPSYPVYSGYPYPPPFPPSPYSQQSGFGPRRRPGQRRMQYDGKPAGACFFCKEAGHRIADCKKAKAAANH